MKRTEKYLSDLLRVFSSVKDKHESNYRCDEILVEMSGDATFFTEILEDHLRKPGSLNTLHYPVVGINIALNKYFGLVANCWIPLPDRDSTFSTKSIHHHGDMLLSTVTAFGPGYEHWTFQKPEVVDVENEIFSLKSIERRPHPRHHVAFVDAWVAHLPFYPPDLTVTYALWSSRFPANWRDSLKRLPLIQSNSKRLRRLAASAGLTKQLELKVIEYFDFYPSCDGFKGMRERQEFECSNNADYLASLFNVIQGTGNEPLAGIIEEKLASQEKIDDRELVKKLLGDLKKGVPIEGRISSNHFGLDYANFTSEQILEALATQDQ